MNSVKTLQVMRLPLLIISPVMVIVLLAGVGTRAFGENYDLAAVGDLSCSTDGKKTLKAIGKTGPDLTLILGDLSYKKESCQVLC